MLHTNNENQSDLIPRINGAVENFQRGQYDEAMSAMREIVATDPNCAPAWHALALMTNERMGADEAIPLMEKATSLPGSQLPFAIDLLNLYVQTNRFLPALNLSEQLLQRVPEHSDVWHLRGQALQQANALADAIESLQYAQQLAPDNVTYLASLAFAYDSHGEAAQAEALYTRCLAHDENFVSCVINYGDFLRRQERLQEAVALLQGYIARRGEQPLVVWNLASALAEQQQCAQAILLFEKVIASGVQDTRLWQSLGVSLLREGRVDEAIRATDKALSLDAENHKARYLRGQAYFHQSKFEAALTDMEARWLVPDDHDKPRPFDFPVWQGEDIPPGKTLLVWQEQGVGDEILFASQWTHLQDSGISVLIESHPRLLPLLARSFPDLHFFPRNATPEIPPGYAICAQQSAGSFMRHLYMKRGWANPSAYLQADASLVKNLRNKRSNDANKPTIGIAWRSANKQAAWRRQRDIPLTLLAKLLSGIDANWVNIQHGDTSKDEQELKELAPGIEITRDESIDPLQDLDRFAAQLQSLDLVITVCNATLHLAGALGCPTIGLVPTAATWMWQQQRSDSIWYPNVSLVRQTQAGVWDDVIDRVVKETTCKE